MGVKDGKDSVLFKGKATESLAMLQWVYRGHKVDFFIFTFMGVVLRMGLDMEELES